MFLGICVVFLHDTCSQYVFLAHDTNTYLTTLSFGVGEQVSNRLRWAVTHARVYFDLWRNTSDLKFVKHRLCLGIGSACTTSWPTMYLFCISQFLDCRYLWELVLHIHLCTYCIYVYWFVSPRSQCTAVSVLNCFYFQMSVLSRFRVLQKTLIGQK